MEIFVKKNRFGAETKIFVGDSCDLTEILTSIKEKNISIEEVEFSSNVAAGTILKAAKNGGMMFEVSKNKIMECLKNCPST